MLHNLFRISIFDIRISSEGLVGISDDIKPKKQKVENKPEPKTIEPIDPDSVEVRVAKGRDRVSELYDSFLSDSHYYIGDHSDVSSPQPETPEHSDSSPPVKKSSKLGIVILFLALAIVGLLIWQSYPSLKSLYDDLTGKTPENESADETPYSNIPAQDYTSGSTNSSTMEDTGETAAPASTEPAINKASISIQVLNGNGISGSAADVEATLETAGFSVTSVTNAKKFTYTSSIIYYKTGKTDEANAVKDALPNLVTELENSDTLTTSYDIVIVVGKT
jgi:hypothetical protein